MCYVKSAGSIQNIEELKLTDRIVTLLRDVPVEELIETARMGKLVAYEGISDKSARQIMDAVDQAGLLFHDKYANYRELLYVWGVLERPRTNAEYEGQIIITRKIIRQIDEILQSLYALEREVLMAEFGISDHQHKAKKEIAQDLGITSGRLRTLESHALQKLRLDSRRRVMTRVLEQASDF